MNLKLALVERFAPTDLGRPDSLLEEVDLHGRTNALGASGNQVVSGVVKPSRRAGKLKRQDTSEKTTVARIMARAEERVRESFEHRPSGLVIALNAEVVAVRDISSPSAVLKVETRSIENLNMIELFSEQGMLMLSLEILQRPPMAPPELRRDITLSGAPATAAAGTLLTQAITVQPQLLTVTANSLSVTYGQFNPSAPGFYSATYNFVNGDTAATVFKGQPAISASQPNGTPVTAASPQGTYPINVTQGTMALINSNYLLTSSSFISGTLTITGNKPQTISFPALTPLVYGQKGSVALTATASSGGPVTYTVVSGPGTVTGSTLNVTGAGTIKITANQLGYGQYEAAPPVTQDLVVSPAPLTVTAPSSSYPYGTNISTALATASPIITGWVVTSDATKVTCNACLTTTATSTSNPGSYPISVTPTALTLGSSIAANYTFQSFVPGTVTITKGTQTITFATLPTVIIYGDQVILTAKSSSGLPVTLTLTGPGYFSNPGSTIRLGSIFLTNPTSGMAAYGATGTGPIVITASQAGNADYGAAPSVIQSQTVKPATLIVQANNTTREYGAPNPTFDYVFVPSAESGVGFQNGDSDIPSVITGLPTLTTTATSTSPAGTYPIVITQGTLAALPLSSPNYTFQFVNGTLTVLPAGSYTMTTNPSSLTIARGHSAQSTITITPLNLYQGTVTLSCGPLPANVSCTVSPSTYTFPGNQTGGNPSENPALGTITVNTTAATVVGALPADKSNLRLAGLLIPGALGGLFLLFARKRAAKAAGVWSLCALLSIGFGVFSITSCGGKSGLATAAPGTITITIGRCT